MRDRKRSKGGISLNIIIDTETGEMMDYFWNEDHEQPPLIKPKSGPEKPQKRRSRKH